MWITLAQENGEAPDAVIPNLFGRLDTLAHPEMLVDNLQKLSIISAAIFVTVGIVCLLQGYKLYKGVVIFMALALGWIVGHHLGKHIEAEFVVATCLGVLLAVVAWPFMKYGVALAGALAGAFIGANAWSALAERINSSGSVTLPPDAYWAGALIGLVLFGLLTFILFEWSIVLFTSVSGSVLAVIGILALLLQIPAWQEGLTKSLTANALVIPMLVIVPAVAGLVLQHQFGAGQKLEAAKE